MEAKIDYARISTENIDFDKVRQERTEQQFGGYASYTAGNPIQFKGADAVLAERFEYIQKEILDGKPVASKNTEKKPYSEMSMEELETKLSAAESSADSWKKMLDRTGWSSDEYPRRKAEYNAAVDEVNAIKNEIFSRNQEASLSRLNDESKGALEACYLFETNFLQQNRLNVTDIESVVKTGLYTKVWSELKEGAKSQLEEQGISGEEFKSIYEYYSFKRDAERASERAAETEAAYENANVLEKIGMNAETILNTPVRGGMAASEILRSFFYNDPHAPLNINSPDFDLMNDSDTVRAETMKDINNDTLNTVYQVGMGTADNAMLVAMGGAPGVILSAVNSSTSAAKSSTERGSSKEQALKMGFNSAATDLIMNKLPVEECIPALKGDGVAKQAIVQGIKNVAGTEINAISDDYINGNNSQYHMDVMAQLKEGKTLEEAQKIAMGKAFREAVASGLTGAASSVTQNVNIPLKFLPNGKLDRNAMKANTAMDTNSVKQNTDVQKTETETVKQPKKATEMSR